MDAVELNTEPEFTRAENFIAWFVSLALVALCCYTAYVYGRAQGRKDIARVVCHDPVSDYYEVCQP